MVKRDIKIKENELGKIFKNHRLQLGRSIESFIDYPSHEGLLDEQWISTKSVSNFEQGYNIPSLKSLRNLSIAYQVDLIALISEIEPYI